MFSRGLPRLLSLHRQLLLWLLLPQAVLWMAGAFGSYHMAARYTNRAIDASLTQSMRSLARQVKPIGNGLYIDFPRAAQDIIEADPEDRVFYMVSTPPGQFILGNQTLPAPPTQATQRLDIPILYDANLGETPVRVAALYLRYGEADARPQTMLVQVARGRTSRDVLAREILADIALPLSGLMILMSMIVWAGIRAGLAPLARVRALVEDRAPNDLAPLRLEAAPAEVRSLVSALNTLLAAVQSNLASQRRFISDAAHQLRTPLAGLKSQTELALKEATDAGLKRRLERVHQSAARSAHLVSQLLTLARAEPETSTALGRAQVDLAHLVQEVTMELVPRALRAGADLGLSEEAEDTPPLVVEGNAFLLREALVNVIDNAIRYGGKGNVITANAHAEGLQAVVDIDDTGPGIPDAQHAAVFERFFRLDTGDEGCGLGLPIVREIVARHAGTVTLRSLSPQGLRVSIRLPLHMAGR
jgi:two-component system, OmpR family, sensor histidine kinase TctE